MSCGVVACSIEHRVSAWGDVLPHEVKGRTCSACDCAKILAIHVGTVAGYGAGLFRCIDLRYNVTVYVATLPDVSARMQCMQVEVLKKLGSSSGVRLINLLCHRNRCIFRSWHGIMLQKCHKQ